MKKVALSLALLALAPSANAAGQDRKPETIQFEASDGLRVSADLYLAHAEPKTPFIVLFHQANWSRGEYLEIAPKLNKLGFNCMAVDQRSGGEVNGVPNATHAAAKAAGKATAFPDALPDMIAALELARSKYARGKLVAWGSSYSSALVLKLAGTQPKLVDGVLSFSPGEYFVDHGKSKTWIAESAGAIECPVFITSAKQEQGAWMPIFERIGSEKKRSFLPASAGNHGSRALWKKFEDCGVYWEAVEQFLSENFLPSRSQE